MAATTNQTIQKTCGKRQAYPVKASTDIPEGTLVFIDTNGYATTAIAAGANKFAGVAIKQADNSSGVDGAITVEVDREHEAIYYLDGASFTQASVGVACYASDNFTVTATSTSNVAIGTIVEYVSATRVGVAINAI